LSVPWGLFAGLAAVGCASESFSAKPEPDSEAIAACQVFVESWCSTATRCTVEAELIPEADDAAARSTCIAAGERTVGCAEATGIRAGYHACMRDVAAVSCPAIVEPLRSGAAPELPATCHGVVEVPE
jgi:hypothetical protein